MSQEKYDPPVDQVLGQSQKMSDPVPYLGALVSGRQPDMVDKPAHYMLIEAKDVQAIDVIRAVLGEEGYTAYCRGNALKYLLRDKWNRIEDVGKARTYCDFMLGGKRG